MERLPVNNNNNIEAVHRVASYLVTKGVPPAELVLAMPGTCFPRCWCHADDTTNIGSFGKQKCVVL